MKKYSFYIKVVAVIFAYNILSKSFGVKKAENKVQEVLQVDNGFFDFF